MENKIIHGDCREELCTLPHNSIHLVVTDPPYFLDGFDNQWKKGKVQEKTTGAIGGLPRGMKFDPAQGRMLQSFMTSVNEPLIKVIRPGAYALIFSQPRLVHRMAVSLEDVGFEIRDIYAWFFTRNAQTKAFGMNHFIDNLNENETVKESLKIQLKGKKTPQLRPMFELIILAQKPKDGTFVENWLSHRTGLVNIETELNYEKPKTLMHVEKPTHKREHPTEKPIKLIEHLIKLFSDPGQIVLDPFLGSGTTAVAAKNTKRHYTGIEINKEYIDLSNHRLNHQMPQGIF